MFGSYEMVDDALKIRFDGLPIHAVCYYQSYQSKDMTIEQIDDILDPMPPLCPLSNVTRNNQKDVTQAQLINEQDCLGMTPLHILACSTKHDIEMYKLIVFWYPDSLITEDKWGCVPLLYAIRGSTSQKIIQFLIDRQKSTFPSHILDWGKMIKTLCRAEASLHVVRRLLGIQQESFPDQNVDWQKAAEELTVCILVDCDYSEESWRGDFVDRWAEMLTALRRGSFEKGLVVRPTREELIESLLGIQKRFFANQSQNELDLRIICEELVQPLKEWWRPSTQESMRMFHFLVKCNIAERLNAIGVKRCKSLVKRLSSSESVALLDDNYFDSIHSKLVAYEQVAFAGANPHHTMPFRVY